MATPIGLDTASAFAAYQAALSNFQECEFASASPRVEPVVASAVPSRVTPRDDGFIGRLVRLAGQAFGDCAERSGLDPAQTPLFLAVPEQARFERRSRHPRLKLLQELADALGVALHPYSEIIAEGKAGFVLALARARDALAAGHVSACFVGGVDSLLNAWDLRRLNQAFRLKREGVPHGLIPGEAAAVLAVARSDSRPTRVESDILGLGWATEAPQGTLAAGGIASGRALQRALENALADAGTSERDIGVRVSDVNGEPFAGMESLLAGTRVFRSYRPSLPVRYLAGSTGECGAAMGPMLLALGAELVRRGIERGPAACEVASDSGLRGACIVSAR